MVGYRDSGYKSAKSRCCAIDALHTLVGLTPPDADPRTVTQTLRALFRWTKTFRRGRARPILRRAEIPIVGPDPAASPPPRPRLAAAARVRPPRRFAVAGTPPSRTWPSCTTPLCGTTTPARVSWATSLSTQRRSMSGSSDRRPTSCWKANWLRCPRRRPLPLASGARALLEVTRSGLARLVALPGVRGGGSPPCRAVPPRRFDAGCDGHVAG